MTVTSITIDGTERKSVVLNESLEIEGASNGKVGTCTFAIQNSPFIEMLGRDESIASQFGYGHATFSDPKLTEDTSTAQHNMYHNETFAAGEKYIISYDVEAAGRTWIAIGCGADSFFKSYFDLSSGAVGSTSSTHEASIAPLGSGVYRCTVRFTATSGGFLAVSLYLASGDGITSYTGDGASGVNVTAAYIADIFSSWASVQNEVIVYSGSRKLFGGYVATIETAKVAGAIVTYAVTCQDYSILLERCVITSAESYTAQSDETILDDIFSTYCSAISTTPVTSVTASVTIEFPAGTTVRQAVEKIVEKTGAIWWITTGKALEYGDSADVDDAPFELLEDAVTIYDYDGAAAIDGAFTKFRSSYNSSTGFLSEDLTASNSHGLARVDTQNLQIGTRYTIIVEAKGGTRDWLAIVHEANGWGDIAWFDVSNGALGTQYGWTYKRIEEIDDGWYRCYLSTVMDATGDQLNIYLDNADDNPINYNGDGSSGLYIRRVTIMQGAPFRLDSFSHSLDGSRMANDVTVHGAGGSTSTVAEHLGATGDDGHIYNSDPSTWPVPAGGQTVDTIGKVEVFSGWDTSTSQYVHRVGLWRFDTSGISSTAVIQSATLRIYVTGLTYDTADWDIGLEYYANSNWPIDWVDWTTTPDNSAFGYGRPAAAIPGWMEIPLTAPDTNISRSTYTGVRIHLRYSGAGSPGGLSSFVAHGYGDTNPAQLEITYYEPIVGSDSDATSIATYGTLKRAIFDSSITSVAEANLRAQVEIAQYKDPAEFGALVARQDGLALGDLVQITSATHDIDDTFLVRGLRWSWPSNIFQAAVEFGDFNPDLIDRLRKLIQYGE